MTAPKPNAELAARVAARVALVERVRDILVDFNWSNYGLDLMEDAETDWADYLADRLVAEIFGPRPTERDDDSRGDALGKPAPEGITRPWTPDENLPGGGTRVTVKRACNGCGELIGDVSEAEMERAIAGQPAEDVTAECPRCRPAAEATS